MRAISRRQFVQSGSALAMAMALPAATGGFSSRLGPAAPEGGFAMKGYWIWGGSVMRDEDGKYHMFATRWPTSLHFEPHRLTNAEIVRAVSDRAVGPYEFAEIVLPARGGEFFDGRATLSPAIQRSGDLYLLYYTGTTFTGPSPGTGSPASKAQVSEAFAKQRIGLATAPSLNGPWTRREAPAVMPRPGRWDTLMTGSPAACALADGSVLLIYKSTRREGMVVELGVAKAERFDGSYRRLLGDPIFRVESQMKHLDDPFVWQSGSGFELLMKDVDGEITREKGAGIHATSADGVEWQISSPPKAYSRTIAIAGEKKVSYARAERPQLLIEDGKPTHLFLAVAGQPTGNGNYGFAHNIAIPLAG